jgi:hypothetical protein
VWIGLYAVTYSIAAPSFTEVDETRSRSSHLWRSRVCLSALTLLLLPSSLFLESMIEGQGASGVTVPSSRGVCLRGSATE